MWVAFPVLLCNKGRQTNLSMPQLPYLLEIYNYLKIKKNPSITGVKTRPKISIFKNILKSQL